MAGGRYKIIRKIADGGMAEIFLGSQHGAEGFERPVVLKRILAPLVADPKFKNVLIDEAHVAMGLIHSNIVQVLDLGHSKGRYYLVLELVDGWDLNQVWNRSRATGLALPMEIALYVAAEVCRALAYAHHRTRHGKPLAIVHRDVSPHNVLLSEQGEVKLTDFGIAKALVRREQTLQGVIKGKLAFMSPEQASGAVIDARSDLFAVGTMLYLFATGRRPFEAPTDLEAILRVQKADFPPPEQVNPKIQPPLAALIRKAMRLAPSERHQSAEELLVDIETLQRNVFKPAGQTELKRWLAELQGRDGVLPAGRTGNTMPPLAAEEIAELDDHDFVLEQSSLDATAAADSRPSPAPPPPDSAAPAPVAPESSQQKTRTEAPITEPVRRAEPRRRGLLVGAVLVAGGVVVWRVFSSPRPEPRPETAPPATPQPVPEPPATSASAALPTTRRDAAATPSRDEARPNAAAGDAGQRTDARDTDDDEDENELLTHAEADVEQKVIGESADDTTEARPPGVAPARKPARTTGAGASAPPAEPPVVSVRVVSHPEGAVIKLHTRVFGRAPMSLRFRSGMKFELTFVKAGYATTTKTFTPSARPNQQVVVTLKKKAPPRKKSFLQRLFGR